MNPTGRSLRLASMSFPSRIALLTTGISAAGLLSLSLAGLLAWPFFLLLLGVHLIVSRRFHASLPVTASQVTVWTLLLFTFELFRISLHGWDIVVPALRDIIVFFAVARLILPKTNREIYQILGISLTECTLSTIFTQSPLFLIGLMLTAGLIPMILSDLDEKAFAMSPERKNSSLHWPKVWAGIFIISCLLFFIVPRPSSTLIRSGVIKDTRTGFSEEIRLSRSEAVDSDRNIVMRVVWTKGSIPELFYLGGSRLERLTKDGFFREDTVPESFFPVAGETDRLVIYPTGLDSLNVFFPFHLSQVSPGNCIRKGPNLYWSQDAPPAYELKVNRSGTFAPYTGKDMPEELGELAALSRRIAGEGPTELRIRRLDAYLKTTCSYTLEGLRIPGGISPVHWFVFDGRQGNCEHFASALAAMLRGCGIPSRVVTGFLVHEFNDAGGYFIVRADDAHAWVEYLDGMWRTLEATPQSVAAGQRRSSVMDALKFRWIRWVIQYSLEDQVRIATTVFFNPHDIEHEVGYALAGSMGAAILALVVWLLYYKAAKSRAGFYPKVVRAIIGRGLPLDPRAVHEEHRIKIASNWPELHRHFDIFLNDYLAWRFGEKKIDMKASTEKMLREVRENRLPAGLHKK